MLSKIFNYAEDEDGNLGWMEQDASETFNAGGGRLVAHDLLEHFKPVNNSSYDELIALGAILFVRYAHAKTDIRLEDLSYDAASCIMASVGRKEHWPETRTKKLEPWLETIIDDLVTQADEIAHEDTEQDSEVFSSAMVSAIRTGYRKAARRFHKSPATAARAFMLVSREVDKLTSYAYQGAKIRVSVNCKTGDVTIKQLNRGYFDE